MRRAKSLPETSVGHRSAIYYLLHEYLKDLNPSLFPSLPANPKPTTNRGVTFGGDKPTPAPAPLPARCADLVPDLDFTLFPDAVASTLATQIFGYEPRQRAAKAVGDEGS